MTFLSSLPVLRVLLSVQVYSGGIGSYALLAMLMAMLQVSSSKICIKMFNNIVALKACYLQLLA